MYYVARIPWPLYPLFLYHDNVWDDQLGGNDSPLTEVILDRIKQDAYKICIVPTDSANYRFMRKVYGLDKTLSE